jgi:hypothetical protein
MSPSTRLSRRAAASNRSCAPGTPDLSLSEVLAAVAFVNSSRKRSLEHDDSSEGEGGSPSKRLRGPLAPPSASSSMRSSSPTGVPVPDPFPSHVSESLYKNIQAEGSLDVWIAAADKLGLLEPEKLVRSLFWLTRPFPN